MRADGPAVEIRLCRHPPVEPALELLGAHLSGQVDGERLRDRHHTLLPREHLGVAHPVDRLEEEARVVIDEIVEAPRAHGPAGDDAAWPVRLACARDDALVDQVDEGLRDHVGVDAEMAPVPQVAEHGVGHAPEPDLEGRAVADNACHVARDPLRRLADRRMLVLDDRRVDRDQVIEAPERHQAVAVGSWHPRVDLGDDRPRGEDGRPRHVDGDAEAAHAVAVRRRHLHQRHVDGQPTAADEGGDLRERDRDVLDLTRRCERADVGADVEHPVPEGRRTAGDRAVGEEVHELDAGRQGGAVLEGPEQRARGGAGAPDKDPGAGMHTLHGLLCGDRTLVPAADHTTSSDPGLEMTPRVSHPGRCESNDPGSDAASRPEGRQAGRRAKQTGGRGRRARNPHCPPYLPSFGDTVKQPKTLSVVDVRRLTEAALDRTRDTLGRPDTDLSHELRTLEADRRFSPAAATLFQQLLGRLGIVSTRPLGLPVDREPYWLRSGHPLADYQSRPELPDTADVVIIGAGLTGASAAYHLAEPVRTRGLRVVVLDQGDPACEASGRNGGNFELIPENSVGIYEGLARERLSFLRHCYPGVPEAVLQAESERQASLVFGLAVRNRDRLKAIVQQESIACDFSPRGWLYLAHTEREEQALCEEVTLAAQHGQRIELWSRSRIRDEFGFKTAYLGRFIPGDGTFHPFKYACGLLQSALC